MNFKTNGKKNEEFKLKSGKDKLYTLSTMFNTVLEVFLGTPGQEKEVEEIKYEKKKSKYPCLKMI